MESKRFQRMEDTVVRELYLKVPFQMLSEEGFPFFPGFDDIVSS